jgi:hypothetical protein
MHLCNQGASGVDNAQLTFLRFRAHARRHSVCAENEHSADRNLLDRFHKYGPAATQLVHHVAVVHDFVMNVNRPSVGFERQFNDINSADYASAKPTWAYPHQSLSPVGGALNMS